jgi:acetyl esterase/lipase
MTGSNSASEPATPTRAAVHPPADTTAYGPDPAQVYDVRLPSATPTGPSVVVVHGGFWREQFDRDHAAAEAQAFADAGHPTAVIEYRRTGMPGGGYPGTFDDVRAAVAAVAADARIPPPLVAVGHSAGGHLALWAACQPDSGLAGVVSLAGCIDLGSTARLDLGSGAAEVLMGGGPEDVPERYAVADPALLVPAPVPVLIVHGTEDDEVPVEIAHSYAQLAAAAGHPATVEVLPGVGHYELVDPDDPAFSTVLRAVATFPWTLD